MADTGREVVGTIALVYSHEVISEIQAFLSVDNILNDTYAIYANLPGSAAGLYTMPRRRVTTGLSFQ